MTSTTVIYCLWAVYGSAGDVVKYGFLFVLFITVFYPFFAAERRQARLAASSPAPQPAPAARASAPAPASAATPPRPSTN